MKNRSLVRLFVGAAVLVPSLVSLRAASLTWNPATNLAGASDGAGVWTSLETNWWDGLIATNWSSVNPDSATFGAGGAAGVVTLGEAISVNNLTFAPVSGGEYQLTGSSLAFLGSSVVTLQTNATISSPVSGSMRVAGGGTLALDGSGSSLGTVTVVGGSTLSLTGAAGVTMASLNLGDNNLASGSGTILVGGTSVLTVTNSLLFGNPSGVGGTGVQTGGRVVYTPVNSTFRIAHWPSESSTYTLSGGALVSTGSMVYVGWDGNGTFNQSAGTTTVYGLRISGGDTGTHTGQGVLNFTGGRIEIGAGGMPARATSEVEYMGGGVLAATASWSGNGSFNLTGTNGNLTIDTAANTVTMTGGWSGNGGYLKTGSGTLVVQGNSSFTGDVTVAQGTLQGGAVAGTQYPNGFGANGSGRTIWLQPGTTLRMDGRDIMNPLVNVHVNGATITNNGFNRLGPLTLVGGTIRGGTGNASQTFQNYVIQSSVTVTGTTASRIVGSRSTYPGFHLESAAIPFNVADVTAGVDLDVSAALANISNTGANGGFVKNGAGTMALSGGSIAKGAAVAGAGELLITNGSWSGSLVISNGATVRAIGGAGLMGQYYNGAQLNVGNANPNMASLAVMNAYLATQNVNILYSSTMAGDGSFFDFDTGAGLRFPPGGYNLGANNSVNFHVRWVGKYNAPVAGTYVFSTSSDDGSMIWIDGTNVVNNNFFQGVVARSNSVGLAAGLHDIVVAFYQGGGGLGLNASNTVPNSYTGILQNALLSSGPGIGSLSGEAGGLLEISNGLLTVAQSAAGSYSGTITGNGGLYKIGTAALTINGPVAYTDATVVAAGSLVGNVPFTSTPLVTVQPGGTIGGTGVFNIITVQDGGFVNPATSGGAGTLVVTNLTLGSGVTNIVDITATTNDIVAAGALAANGSRVVVSPQVALVNGSYPIATYGTLGSAYNSIIRNLNPAVSGAKRFTLDYSVPNQINLTVADAALLKWSGAVNGTWDIGATTNWINTGSSLPSTFLNYDSVLFDDSAIGNFAINSFQSLEPTAVVFSNNATTYSVASTGSVAHLAGGIWKYGAGTTTVGFVNATFTAAVNAVAGRLSVGATGTFGQAAAINVLPGGQVNINGIAQPNHNYIWYIGGNGSDGRGAIMNTNASVGIGSTVKWIHLTTNASIGTFGLTTAENARMDVALNGGIAGNGFTLTKVGNNVLPMRGSATNLQLIINEGFVYGETVDNPFGSNVIVNAGAFIGGFASARIFSVPLTLNGGTLSARSDGGAPVWTGPVSVPTNSFLTSNPNLYGYTAEALNVNGSISGNGGLTIYGNSTTTFRGTNSYTGTTILQNAGGTLSLATSNGYSLVSPVVQVGHLVNGGSFAMIETLANNQFGPNVGMTFGGSPGDWTYLKLRGTEQYIQTINSDDNGGGVLESTENDIGITADSVLHIVGAGDSYWSGTFLRDRAGTNSLTSKLRIVKAGTGKLSLATGNSPSPMFTGGIIVSNGTLNLKTRWAAGTAPIRMAGGTLALDASGLQEGSIVQTGINTTSNNPVNTAMKLSTPRPNLNSDYGDNTTWIYSGYLVVTGTMPRTLTFAENVDDVSWLQINGVQVLNDGTWNNPTLGTITLAPGLHRFDARFQNGAGGAGAVASGWWTANTFGFGVDKQGRGQAVFTNFTPVTDAGDGLFLISEVTVTNDIVLAANTPLRVSNLIGPTNTISGVISDGGSGFGITKVGAGALKIESTNAYAGATVVSEGSLYVNGYIPSLSTMTVNSNALLGGTGIVNSATTVLGGGCVGSRQSGYIGKLSLDNGLTLNDGARVACQLNGATPQLNVAAPFQTAVGGTNLVEIYSAAGPITAGTYALIKYNGSIGGGGFNSLVLAQPLPNGAQGYLNDNVGAFTIELVITNIGSGVRWIGATSNIWDIGISSHWNFRDSGIPTTFLDGYAVLFDDLAVGNFTSVVAQTVRPSSVLVSNNTAAFTFGASAFGITGTASLVKQGTNRLTIATAANRYTGGTTVDAGSIVIGATRPFGFTTGVTVNAGGQVNFNGVSQAGISYNWTIAGDGPGGSGALFNTNAAIAGNSSVLNLTLAGNATIAIHGPGNSDAGRFDIGLGGTLNGNGFQITKTGRSQLNFRGTTVGLTNILVLEGIAVSENVNNSLGANVRVESGARVAGYGGVTNSAAIQLNGGAISSWGGSPSDWNGEVTLLTGSFINNDNGVTGYTPSDLNINGRVTGPGALTKIAAQTATLTAVNDFGGSLVVNGGTLLLTGANAYSNSTTVNVGGTLRIAGGADRLPVTTALAVNGGDTGASLFDLNGFNQTVAVLSGTNTYGSKINLGGAVLTINGSGSGVYYGSITGAGSVVRSGAGTLTLSASNLYTGGTVVNSGTLAVRHPASAGSGSITVNGGTLAFDASGLWEGRVNGAFNTTNANPKWAANSTTEKANSTVNTVYPDNTTYIYSGLLNITNTSPVTWTFVEQFDDYTLLKIDGVTLLNDGTWNNPTKATVTLAPGLHTFELRNGEGAGLIGPNSGWPLGLGVDVQGRDQLTATNFIQLTDIGDGSLYRRDDFAFGNDIVLAADGNFSTPVAKVPVRQSGSVSGDGGFTKTGLGWLIQEGTNIYAGPVAVSTGAFFVNGQNSGTGTVSVASGAQLWGSGSINGAVNVAAGAVLGAKAGVTNAGVTLTVNELTLNDGAIFGAFINGTNPTVRVLNAGAFAPANTTIVRVVTTAPLAVGTYPIIAYNTSIGGAGLGALALELLPNGAQGFLNDNGVDMIELVINNAGEGLKWYGSTTNGNWDVLSTPNWAAIPAAVATVFQNFDKVFFDDTATNFSVILPASVTPSSLVVSNETQQYNFSGGAIAGSVGFLKLGAAKLVLSNASTFTGPTRVEAGTLSIVADTSLGAAPGSAVQTQLTLNAGATLEALASSTIPANRGLAIGPATDSGSVTIATATGVNFAINSVIANRPGATGTLVKTGSGTLTVSAASTYSGGTIVDEGTLASAKPGAQIGPFLAGTPVTINSAGTLQFNNGDAFGYTTGAPSALNINGGKVTTLGGAFRITLLGGGLLTFNGGQLTSATNNTGDGNGTYLLNANINVLSNDTGAVINPFGGMSLNLPNTTITVADGTNSADLLIATRLINWPNVLSGFTKEGDGTLQLTASNNTYGGSTIVNAGTLLVGDGVSGSLGTNTSITANGTIIWNLPGTTLVPAAIGGSGQIVQASPGTLHLTAGNTLSGLAIVSNGTLIAANSLAAAVVVRPGANLLGNSTVASITNDGTVAPGPGIATLIANGGTGEYSAGPGANLAFEIGGLTAGTGHDQLVLTGPANLNGALTVTLTNGFTPAFGDSFQLAIILGGVNGAFATTNLPALPATNAWNVDYTGGITLSVIAAPAAPPTGYNAFSNNYVLVNGPEGDDDGDGFANLLEYVTGANPTNIDTIARVQSIRTNGLFALRFTRTTNSVDTTLIVEGTYAATNNAAWIGFATNINGIWGVTNVVETGGPDVMNVTVPDNAPAATNRFLRLRVTRP